MVGKKGHKKVKKNAAVTIRVIIDGIMEYFVQLVCISTVNFERFDLSTHLHIIDIPT